ncbi:MAG: hypothetical protein H0V01_15070 [Bacteroidetes bacterium]|nr:hypothetical protein [Bacteroidota bacterium]HET6245296.1 hypothetical protein [Bacteroidia bacterium]
MKTLVTVLFLLLFLITDSFSQPWKRKRKEVIYSLGATNFLGDLGGLNRTASPFVLDLEPVMTRPAVGFGYRYTLNPYSKVRGSVIWGILKGDDQLTAEPFRNNRNLHFRSHIVEISGVYEMYFNQEQSGNRYNIKGARGMRAKNTTYYGFIGFGAFYFNPKAVYNGSWVALQPLGTEGQGQPGGKPKYSRINVAIPMGLGARYAIDRYWKIGLEIGYRKTFTDYMDDVGGNYYDNKKLRDLKGDKAADLADPNLGKFPYQYDENGKTHPSNQRGDIKGRNDAYLFAMFSLNYTLQKRSSRAKF